jgi:aminopeptidase N
VRWPFLDEGLNSYAEAEAMSAWRGAGSVVDSPVLKVDLVAAQETRARHLHHDERIAQPAWAFSTGSAYGALVYARTAVLLQTIAQVYGKERMDRALGVYARKFRFAHPTPDDFIDVVAVEVGGAAATALRTALFEKGWVDYAVTGMSSHPARKPAGIFDVAGKRETVAATTRDEGRHEGWVLVKRRGTLRFPIEIELVADDGSKQRVPWDGESDTIRVPYAGSSPLRAVLLDPDRRILVDDDPTNDFATATGKTTAGAPRTLERATYWAELVMGLLSP